MTDARLTLSETERIAASAGWRAQRIEVFETACGRVVAKGQRPPRSAARYRALNALAGLLGVPSLRAAPARGGAAAQAVEVRRLQALRAAGAPVPDLLHVAPDHFVMSWLGANHLSRLLHQRHPAGIDLWRQGAFTLVRVHAAGQYFSQCFGRNVIVDDACDPPRLAGMIDFEDDSLEVMGLPEAQVRDWLVYLQSTLWILNLPMAPLDAVLDDVLAAERAEVRARFARACRRLAWLRMLPASRRWGRDTLAVQVVASAAQRWRQRHAAEL